MGSPFGRRLSCRRLRPLSERRCGRVPLPDGAEEALSKAAFSSSFVADCALCAGSIVFQDVWAYLPRSFTKRLVDHGRRHFRAETRGVLCMSGVGIWLGISWIKIGSQQYPT